MSEIQSSYKPAIDVMRIVSILAVILIHTSTRFLEASHYDLRNHLDTFALNQAARFAVPLFFMISGFVLTLSFSAHQNYLMHFKKRISKIFIPYLFWSAIYYVFIYTYHGDNFVQALLTGSASYQLYFIPSLLIFYFLFPAFHKLYAILTKKWIFIGLGLLQVCLLLIDYQQFGLPIYFPLRIVVLNYFMFLLGMIGYHHHEYLLTLLARWKILVISLTVGLGGIVAYESFTRYYQTFNYEAFYLQWRPSIFAYSIFLALSLYYIFSKLKLNAAIIKTLASLSFFVFFIHTWILELVWNTGFHFGLFASVTIVSFTLAYIVHRIPNVSKITG